MISSEFNLSRSVAIGTTLAVGAGSLLMGCRPAANHEQPSQPAGLANGASLRPEPNFEASDGAANKADNLRRVRCTDGTVEAIGGGKLSVKATVSPVPQGAELKVQLESSFGRKVGYVDGEKTSDGLEAEIADPDIAEGAYGRQVVTVAYLNGSIVSVAVCPPGNISTP